MRGEGGANQILTFTDGGKLSRIIFWIFNFNFKFISAGKLRIEY